MRPEVGIDRRLLSAKVIEADVALQVEDEERRDERGDGDERDDSALAHAAPSSGRVAGTGFPTWSADGVEERARPEREAQLVTYQDGEHPNEAAKHTHFYELARVVDHP